MPAKSAKQYGAMQAAKHGIGGLGIPRDVASHFIEKTPAKKRRAFARSLAKKRKD
jgi:hypothetical protein